MVERLLETVGNSQSVASLGVQILGAINRMWDPLVDIYGNLGPSPWLISGH